MTESGPAGIGMTMIGESESCAGAVLGVAQPSVQRRRPWDVSGTRGACSRNGGARAQARRHRSSARTTNLRMTRRTGGQLRMPSKSIRETNGALCTRAHRSFLQSGWERLHGKRAWPPKRGWRKSNRTPAHGRFTDLDARGLLNPREAVARAAAPKRANARNPSPIIPRLY
jgi:hypothetical protein